MGVRPVCEIDLSEHVLEAVEGSGCVVDYGNNEIYGLTTGISSLAGYADAAPGCVFEYVPSVGGFGTGTVVNMTLNSVIVESYTIIIFGDVTGDGNIDSNDAGIITEVENYNIAWDPVTDAVRFKAADLNGDGNVDSNDAGLMVEVENYNLSVDQVTGLAF